MQWKNPDGSITEGVVIEDGDGNKITSFSGGGSGGGTVTQGPAGVASAPWYVAPGTGVTWTLGGALPAFAATPTFNIGTAPTLAVNWSGQSVAISNFPTTHLLGSGALATAQASIGVTASQIVAARTGGVGTGRIAVTLYNFGSATIYFGNTGVTATTGMPLPVGASVTLNTTAALYGIAASGTQTIGVTETF
jgi:hypothetical protein